MDPAPDISSPGPGGSGVESSLKGVICLFVCLIYMHGHSTRYSESGSGSGSGVGSSLKGVICLFLIIDLKTTNIYGWWQN